VGIAVAFIGVFSVRQILTATLAPPSAPTQQVSATEKILVANRDFAVGDLVKEGDVRVVDMPVEFIPRDVVRDVEEVIERIVKVPLISGEMILKHHLADPTNISHDIGFTMSDNKVMMAFPASDLISSLNILQRGDLVDIYVTISKEVEVVEGGSEGSPSAEPDLANIEEQETVNRTLTFDAMQATEISAVIADIQYEQGNYTSVPLDEDGEAPASTETFPSTVRVKAYLLILNPQDALLLKHLVDTGAIFDFVLRAPTSDQLFDLQPVMEEYLIDRYQLEVPR
jgi:pilus assembly protein CpaB